MGDIRSSIFRPCDHPTPSVKNKFASKFIFSSSNTKNIHFLYSVPQRQTRLGDASKNPPPFGRRRSHPVASLLRKRFSAGGCSPISTWDEIRKSCLAHSLRSFSLSLPYVRSFVHSLHSFTRPPLSVVNVRSGFGQTVPDCPHTFPSLPHSRNVPMFGGSASRDCVSVRPASLCSSGPPLTQTLFAPVGGVLRA